MELCDLTVLRPLLERRGFQFSKNMGQNFLIEPAVPARIAEESGAAEDIGVVEIGPGVGALTAQLAARAGRVAAIELDRRLLPVLEETVGGLPNVEIVPGDALKIDLAAFAAEHLPGLRPIVCANLPYNITTPVITAMLKAGCFAQLTLMVQREAAERICAQAGKPEYSAFSVLCQYYARCSVLFDVPADCFFPAPKVTSSVIRMQLRCPAEPEEDRKLFTRLVQAAFAQRRKTLLNALAGEMDRTRTKDDLRTLLADCGLEETVRGERLTPEDFKMLAKLWKENKF